jgi:polysaccharide export outer membrane protein
MAIRRILLAAAILLSGVIGRAADNAAGTPGDSSTGTTAPAVDIKADYLLQRSDLLHVQIFQEDDLTREVRVSQEYTVTLPLIGAIDLHNKTVRQAQELIRSLYDRDYLVNPQVNVTVVEYGKRSVNVIGSVNTPGVIIFPQEQGMTLLDAVARAGGFSRLADKKHVTLTRTVEGKATKYTINADEILQGTSKDAWALVEDDVINVPERIL